MGALDLCAPVCADRRAAGGRGLPGWRTLGWILVAMVTARSCAMAFNRWADADLDAANPRTQHPRHPGGPALAPVCARLHRPDGPRLS